MLRAQEATEFILLRKGKHKRGWRCQNAFSALPFPFLEYFSIPGRFFSQKTPEMQSDHVHPRAEHLSHVQQ